MKAARIRLFISLARLSIDISLGMSGSPEASLEYGRVHNRNQLHCLESVIHDVVSTRNGKLSEINSKQLVKCLSSTRSLVSTISRISSWGMDRLGQQWEWSFHISHQEGALISQVPQKRTLFYEKTGVQFVSVWNRALFVK